MKYRNIKDKLGIGCNKSITSKEESNYENKCSTGYQLCNECKGKSIIFDRYIELIENKARRELLLEMYENAKSKPFPNHTSLWDFENKLKKLSDE